MAITDEQWMAFLETARFLQPTDPTAPVIHGIHGRFIRILVDRLCKFWAQHQATLIPVLSQAAIAALNAVLATKSDIDLVNPPGPQ